MNETAFTFKTMAQPTTALFKDRGSKFLAYAFPIKDIEEAKAHIKTLKKEHPKANHFCVGYRIGVDGDIFRASDDGEPSGSAGRPILGQIDSAGLTNLMVVVVRYFGGTLLGVPGLINAYKTATSESISVAEIIEQNVEFKVHLLFDYSLMNDVMQILKQYEVSIYQQEMLLFCDYFIGIPLINKEGCLKKLAEIQGVEIKN